MTWSSFLAKDKLRFVIVSLCGVAFFGFVGGLVGGLSFPVPEGVTWGERSPFNPGFNIGAAAFAIFAAFVQVQRITKSKSRASANSAEPFKQATFELQTGVQYKMCFIGALLGVLGGLSSYLLSIA